MAGWAVTGLFLFNLERVLRYTPKPFAKNIILKINKIMSCPSDQVLQPPITPITPVTVDALTSLHNLIK